MNRTARAFTLVELLVVVGIIGMLAAMIVPTFNTVVDLAREADCRSNLALIGKAITSYLQTHNDYLPKNDSEGGSYEGYDPNDLLPGRDSSMRWWCNKVYTHGVKRFTIYQCPSDPSRADWGVVAAGYGFNDTLTKEEEIETIFGIKDLERTALVGHCSFITEEPAIVEGMLNPDEPDDWPRGHLPKRDRETRARLGRCGFLMAGGSITTMTFSEALSTKHILFRGRPEKEDD